MTSALASPAPPLVLTPWPALRTKAVARAVETLNATEPVTETVKRSVAATAEALSALQDDQGKAQAVTEEAGIVTGHPVYESFLGFTSARELQQATRQLSGQVHADMASAQINESRYLRDAATERLRQAEGRRIASDIKADDNGAWAKLLGNWGMLPATIMPPVTKRPPTACCWAWMASCLTTAGLG